MTKKSLLLALGVRMAVIPDFASDVARFSETERGAGYHRLHGRTQKLQRI
jgi:hypothetical protein